MARTIQDIIAVGQDLCEAKHSLSHGQFGRWLKAEFGWSDRTARNFMSVAEQFGKSETISDLQIQPTAAYLLAAPSAPEAARRAALDRAQAGEAITTTVAREILAEVRKRRKRKPKPVPSGFLRPRLQKTLSWYQDRCDPNELAVLAHELRQFAENWEREKTNSQAGRRSISAS